MNTKELEHDYEQLKQVLDMLELCHNPDRITLESNEFVRQSKRYLRNKVMQARVKLQTATGKIVPAEIFNRGIM